MLIRTFVAVNFSLPVTKKIADEVVRKRVVLPPGTQVSWIPPANYHVTLSFLGLIEDELLDRIRTRLTTILAQNPPFEMAARGFGQFVQDADKSAILWAAIEKNEALFKLQADVENALADLGFEKESREFHPHVTVGRAKNITGETGWSGEEGIGVSWVKELVVYESKLSAKNSEYVARLRLPLGPQKREEVEKSVAV